MNEPRMLLTIAAVGMLGLLAVASEASGQELDCIDCSLCAIEGVTGHKTMEGDSTSIYNEESQEGTHDGFHSCLTDVFCDSHDGTCDLPDLAWLENLSAAASSGREAAIQWLNDTGGARWAAFAPDRRAIQVRGCGGEVIAHFPLSDPRDAAITMIGVSGLEPHP